MLFISDTFFIVSSFEWKIDISAFPVHARIKHDPDYSFFNIYDARHTTWMNRQWVAQLIRVLI